jgi:hypothetical protein
MPKETDTYNRKHKSEGLFIPTGLFFGLGAGFLMDNVIAGIFLGLGIGFLCYALLRAFRD